MLQKILFAINVLMLAVACGGSSGPSIAEKQLDLCKIELSTVNTSLELCNNELNQCLDSKE